MVSGGDQHLEPCRQPAELVAPRTVLAAVLGVLRSRWSRFTPGTPEAWGVAARLGLVARSKRISWRTRVCRIAQLSLREVVAVGRDPLLQYYCSSILMRLSNSCFSKHLVGFSNVFGCFGDLLMELGDLG